MKSVKIQTVRYLFTLKAQFLLNTYHARKSNSNFCCRARRVSHLVVRWTTSFRHSVDNRNDYYRSLSYFIHL